MTSIERVDAIAHRADITALFGRNDRASFERFFDLAYPASAAAGGCSWVVREDNGAVVAHLAMFPRTLRGAGRSFEAALFGDLIADVSHRNFWTAAKLMRRAVDDLRAEGRIALAYTDPTPPSLPVAKAAGFVPWAELVRFVLPLNRLYLFASRLRSGGHRVRVEIIQPDDPRLAPALLRLGPGPWLGAARTPGMYRAHGSGRPELTPVIVILTSAREPQERAAPLAVALLDRLGATRTVEIVDLLWDDARVSIASVVHSLARAARRNKFDRMYTRSLAGSHLSGELRAAGCMARKDGQPFHRLLLGADPGLPPLDDWVLSPLDGSAW
jgi:hypothetical protein